MKTRQPMAPVRKHAMLRSVIAGLALFVGLTLGAVSSASAQAAPFCSKFDSAIDGWGACSWGPNITVTTSNVGGISPGDPYLKLTDLSGASAACTTDPKYLGDWNAKMGGCGEFCFDFKVFNSGSPANPITPRIYVYGGGGSLAVFVANFTVTALDPWRQHICAPIALGTNPPTSPQGHWVISGGATWNQIITSVTMVSLPVDFTSSPSEIVGYDNLCMNSVDCEEPKKPPPELTGCLKDSKVEVKCNPDGTYTLTLSVVGFAGDQITLTSLTPGVTVAVPLQPWSATTNWTLVGATPGQVVTLSATTTDIGGGNVPGADLCCTGTIKIVMPDCPKPHPPIDVKIEKTGVIVPVPDLPVPGITNFSYTLAVTNVGAGFTGNGAIVVSDFPQPGVTFTGVSAVLATDWSPCGIVAGAVSCTYIGAGPAAPGELLGTITITGYVKDVEKWENCASVGIAPTTGTDANLADNKDCVTLTTEEQKIDLGIKKTGGTSPAPQVNAYAFHLTVTNVGAAFTGANVIVVKDPVPGGMTFNSATGIGWICNSPPSILQGGMLICTYTGAGPSAGQVLPTINIQATANGSPPYHPFKQCAVVGPAPGSGLVDWNPMNDQDCVTVAKPPILVCDPKTTKSIGGSCSCLYEGMTKSSSTMCKCVKGQLVVGKGCETEIVCKRPLVLNRARTACVCVGKLVWNGKDCVEKPAPRPVPKLPKEPDTNPKPLDCTAPLIPNKAGTACVRPAPVIELPNLLDIIPKEPQRPQTDGAAKP